MTSVSLAFDKMVVEAELLRRQLESLRPHVASGHVGSVTDLSLRMEELQKERDAALAEAANLRARVKRMSEREKELRDMLLEAHDRLFRQDEVLIESLRGVPTTPAGPGRGLPPGTAIAVEEVEVDSAKLAGFAIDHVSEQATEEDEIEMAGWVLGRRSPVVSVELAGADGSVRRAPVSVSRPDIRAVYPDLPEAERSGFEIAIPIHELTSEHELVLQAVLTDNTSVAFAVVRLDERSQEGEVTEDTGGEDAEIQEPAVRPPPDPAKLLQYREMIERAREVLASKVPPEATVLIVSKGDDALLRADGRRGRHFPQDDQGRYAGYHPADSASAIQQLEALRAQGAEFLLLPSPQFWWLDHYLDFGKHLEGNYHRVWGDEHCILFQLGPIPGGA